MYDDVDIEALDEAADAAVLDLQGLDAPVLIESIQLLKIECAYFVRVRSADGVEGLAFTNGRAHHLSLIHI